MASACKWNDTTMEDILWPLESPPCVSREVQNFWGINAPRSNPQQMAVKNWQRPRSRGRHNSEVHSLYIPEQKDWASVPIAVTYSILMCYWLPSLPCLTTHSLHVLLGITSQVNYLHSHICLRICFYGNPNWKKEKGAGSVSLVKQRYQLLVFSGCSRQFK